MKISIMRTLQFRNFWSLPRQLLNSVALLFLCMGAESAIPSGYKIENIQGPEGTALEVSGLIQLPDNSFQMTTRRGEVWNYADGKWTLYARGLHEPHGLVAGENKGQFYILQRAELSLLTDEDGDGDADLYETVGAGWGYSGNYHEYAIGLVQDNEGNFYGNLGLSFFRNSPFRGTWLGTKDQKYRGWLFKMSPEGKFTPWASGLRAPNGLNMNPKGEIFITDNQGSYLASGWMTHVKEGDFIGHPDALIWDDKKKGFVEKILAMPPEERFKELDKIRKKPAVYFPYPEMGRSCGHPTWDTTEGKFGPFAGQVFVAEVIDRLIMRVSLEKVGGQYQGACYPFIRDNALGGGSNRIVFDQRDGSMWVGQTARGWGSGHGFKKVTWNGTEPMSLKEVSLTKEGFDLHFTEPLDNTIAMDENKLRIQHHTYAYSNQYGGPKRDRKAVAIQSRKLSKDGKALSLGIEGLKSGYIYEFECKNFENKEGEKVSFGQAWYNVNQLR